MYNGGFILVTIDWKAKVHIIIYNLINEISQKILNLKPKKII